MTPAGDSDMWCLKISLSRTCTRHLSCIDIFLHGPESTHKNGIGNTFTHTSILNQPCTLLRQRAKPSTHQTWRLPLVVLFLSNVVVGDGQEAWEMLLSTAPTSEAFSPRTVLTENICRCVRQIKEKNRPAIMRFLTTSTLTDPPMHTLKVTKSETINSPNMTPAISCPLPVKCGSRRRPESLADALQDWSTSEVFSARTVLTENICRCVQQIK